MFTVLLAAALNIPSPEAFLGWNDDTDRDAVRIETVEATEINCADQTLFPSHPQSYSKLYHEVKYGSYDHSKMTKADEACQTAGLDKNKRCLRPKILHSIVLSDIYNDSCGNFYRGFWHVQFFNTDESMGSLASKGRTFYEDPRAEFKGTFIDGGTYSLTKPEFVKITKPFGSDIENARKYKLEALRSGFHLKANIFVLKSDTHLSH